jgi:hypothetical protein
MGPRQSAAAALLIFVIGCGIAAAQSSPHPALAYSSMRFITTSGPSPLLAFAVDSQGNVYYVDDTVAPSSSLVKLAPDGTEILRAPVGKMQPTAMAVDGSGNVYLYGNCVNRCPDSFNTVFGSVGGVGGWVAKVSPTGAVLFVDGFDKFTSGAAGVAVDTASNIYIVGVSASGTPGGMPATPGSFQTTSCPDGSAFAAKINAAGTQLVYSTYLRGTNCPILPPQQHLLPMEPSAIAVDSSGSLYVAGGGVIPTDWPTTPGAFETVAPAAGVQGSVIVKLTPDGSGLTYSTYLNEGNVYGIAVDGAGQLYVTGSSGGSQSFPITPGAAEPTRLPGGPTTPPTVGFALKLNAAGTGLVYSTFVNFINVNFAANRTFFQTQNPVKIAVDSTGSAYIAGEAFQSGSLPLVNPIQNGINGGGEVVIAKLNPQGSAYQFVTYMGGMLDDFPGGFGIDPNGAVYVSGHSTGTFPALSVTYGGSNQCCWGQDFFVKIVPSATVAVAVLWPEQTTNGFNPNSFGSVGTTTTKLFALGNYGAAAMPVGSISLDDPQFTQTNNCPASLAIGTHCDITVTFRPAALGRFAPTLTASDPSGVVLRTLVLDAIATAIAPAPVIALSASSLAFGPQAVGTSSAAQTITISNTGNASLTFSSISTTGDFSQTNTCGAGIQPSSTCQIQATFTPTAIGQRSGTITLTDNAINSPQVIALTGGVAPDFSMAPPAGGSTSQTINAGQTATFNLSLAPAGGFSGTVTLSCSGAPTGATCLASPASVTLGGSAPVPFTVTVSTAARSSAVPASMSGQLGPASNGPRDFFFWITAATLLTLWFGARRRKLAAVVKPLWTLAVVALLLIVGCGGGSKTTPPPVQMGTPAGTYTIVVSAVSGATTHTQNLTLTVN